MTFSAQHKVKTQEVTRSRGQQCGTSSLLVTSRTRRVRCLWCWTYTLDMSVEEVVLTLVVIDTYITLTM
jgi:hypothetical protein